MSSGRRLLTGQGSRRTNRLDMFPHNAPMLVLVSLGRISILEALQPESKPIHVARVNRQLVPWLELQMRLVREYVEVRHVFPDHGYDIVSRLHILLLRHLKKDRHGYLAQIEY